MSLLFGAPVTAVSTQPRLLIIRFSSFGDIIQGVGVASAFKQTSPTAEVDWLVRADFASILVGQPSLDRVIEFDRKSSILHLLRLAWQLSGFPYTHVYDAHNNLRSRLIGAVFSLRAGLGRFRGQTPPKFARRSKMRWARFRLFRLRRFLRPSIQMPFNGADSYHAPLARWGLAAKVPDRAVYHAIAQPKAETVARVASLKRPLVVLAPSAAWEMKRWPPEHFQRLVELMPEASFVFIGGPEDHFIADMVKSLPSERVLSLAGHLSLGENPWLVKNSDLVIANDTGFLHVADQMQKPTIALIGPTAFGYPSHSTSRTAEIQLTCKPCSKDGRGGCKNTLYKRCLVELSPQSVAEMARALLAESK